MPIFNEGEELNYLEKDDILMSGSPDNFSKVKAQNLYNRTLTRTQLQALISANTLNIGQQYTISNAVSNTMALKVTATGTNILDNVAVRVSNGVNYIYNITTDTAEIIQQINGTGFVKANGTTITYDNSTYLTNINGITAGGELSGTYPNPSLSNNAVTGKVLTGLSISGSSITSTDSILTSLGKLQNQINSLVGGVKYQGTWNASTNTPALVSSVGTSGFYYVVDVAGSTNLNGITDWKVGDWAIFNGTTWQKVDNTDSVISVNGYIGAVTLTTSDIAEGTNLYYTDARVRQAISENIVGINYDNNTGVFSLASGYVIPTTTEQSNWNTAYNNRISSLTTLGNSGAATLIQNVLNIPNYTLSGLGGVPYTGATANVNLGEFGIQGGYFGYDLTPTNTPTTQGTTYWDSTEETVTLIMNGAIQHIGLDTFYNVKNNTGFAIPKGTAVRFAGTDGNSGHLLIAPMLADGSYPSSYYMGITAEVIANGDFGKVVDFGKLRGINTNSYTNGDILYVSTTVAGSFQTTVPTAPNNIIIAATVVNASNNGTLMVRATLGSNINNDEGVKITSPTNGQLLQLQSNGLWENKTKAQVLGGTSSQFVKGDGSLDSTSYQPLDSDLTAIAGLSGDGLLRKTSGTWGMDTNTYLTANQTITISGEASGSGATSITLSLDNNSVTGKVLNGLSISGGSVVSTDSILVGIGKLQNQVNALAGGVNYQGTWNASTNTPSLTSSVGVKGYYYVVSVAGSTNLDGITDWKLGDWAIFNGSTWQKVDNTDAVVSVNGYTGIVTLAKADIGLGNVENTALSTWAGSANITTLGTISSGVWNGTAIGDTYISSASTWNAKIGGSGTTGRLAKFTSSGAVGDSILSESGSNVILTGQYLVATDSSFLGYFGKSSVLVSSTSANDTAIFTPNNFNIGTGSSNILRLQIKSNGQIITNSATDTGEAHIFGGSARVNGTLFTTGNITGGTVSAGVNINLFSSSYGNNGLFNSYGTDNNLKFQAGALGNTQAFIYAHTGVDLLLFAGGSQRVTIASSGAATFSSSVTATNFIGYSITNDYQLRLGYNSTFFYDIGRSSVNGLLHFYGSQSNYTGYVFSGADGERMRIAASGNVLIGTTADDNTNKLQVNGSALFTGQGDATKGTINLVSADSFIRLNTTGGTADKMKWDIRVVSASGFEQLDFRTVNDANNSFSTKLSIAHSGAATFSGSITTTNGGVNYGGANTYVFGDNSDLYLGTSGNSRIKITSSGLVGIGTTSPAYKLDVNGAIAIGNTVTASVATLSTHKVEIVIGGVTYYLLATT